MNEGTACSNCGCQPDGMYWYQVRRNDECTHFCSRRCLVEFIAPEVSKAIVIKHWVPTEEDVRRMSEEST